MRLQYVVVGFLITTADLLYPSSIYLCETNPCDSSVIHWLFILDNRSSQDLVFLVAWYCTRLCCGALCQYQAQVYGLNERKTWLSMCRARSCCCPCTLCAQAVCATTGWNFELHWLKFCSQSARFWPCRKTDVFLKTNCDFSLSAWMSFWLERNLWRCYSDVRITGRTGGTLNDGVPLLLFPRI